MGLFDWLSDAMGSGANPMGGGDPAQMLTRSSNVMDRSQPSLDLTGGVGANMTPPQAPMPLGTDPMTAGGPPSNGPGLPPKPADMAAGPDPTGAPPSPVPLPQPRPPGADGSGPLPPPPPPPVQPPSGGIPGAPPAEPAGPPMSIAPPIAPEQPGAPQGGPISRALGLDPNKTKSVFSGIGAGLTAAGNSAGKSPFQAFASGAGASLEGSEKSTDKTYDQKIKYLQAAVAAQSAGDKAAYNKNYASYLAGKLKADTDKAASDGSGKKTGAWNKPDSQKFIDAQHALASDPEVKASQKLLEQTAKTGEPADVAKAQAAHSALIQSKEAKYLSGVGLDPQQIAKNMATPPGTPPSKNPDGSRSPGNPHVIQTQEQFDSYVKPGQAYIVPYGPHKGEVYIRNGGGAKGGDSGGAAPTSPPAAPGPPPSPMGGDSGAPAQDEE